jgi:ethanolaminephosphotransferase
MPPQTTDSVNNSGESPPLEYLFLTKDSIQALKDFQYNDANHSLLYKYYLSPLAGFLVDHATPSTVAPNTIALFGFAFMIVAYGIIQHHCPTFDHCTPENDVPGYIFLANGIALLVYQNLDKMDGKQARKTGSSSPLGLLFDHGLDACNMFIGIVNIICMFGIASNDLGSIIVIATMSSFPLFVSTWEEYHTHKLELLVINGPSEGLFGNAVMMFATWYFGQQFWHEHSI